MQDTMRRTAAMLAAGSTVIAATSVDAGNGPIVEGAKVRHGHATFERDGATLRIRTGRTTIIDYNRFDIPVGTSVDFMQQGANARVLNRINSAKPTEIMGSLMSNGRVYFVNRAGVVFGKDARIDVNGLFAAAGRISNEDFIAGRDRVTGMQGTVRNDGTIRAVNEVVLAGRTVVNTGSIETGKGGLIALASGESLTLRRTGSQVGIQVAGGTAALQSDGAIAQSGTMRAPGGRIVATSGDLASLAVDLGGTVVASAIDVDAGPGGTVRVAGTLDASGGANGRPKGGQVRVTAGSIEVASSATISADGPRGGGTVLVGGGVQGGDRTLRNASALQVANGAVVSADATERGDGGTIAFWSDERTDFLGTATARGAGLGGRGGFIEASGKRHLLYDGTVNLLGSRGGANGTLLLDPGFLTVQNVAGGPDTLGMASVNAALAVGNLIIQNAGVTQDSGIRWNATSTITGLNTSSLTINSVGPGATATIFVPPDFGVWKGDFVVQTTGGAVNVNAAINRPQGGRLSFTAGGGNSIVVGTTTIATKDSPIEFNSPVSLGNNLTVSAGTGPVTFAGTVTGSGGTRNLTVNSSGTSTFLGTISSVGRFQTDGPGTSIFGGNLSLAGNSSINDRAFFQAGGHTLSNTGSFTTFFGKQVDGPGSLSITHGTGAVTFAGAVGSLVPLGGLSVNSAGNVAFQSSVDGPMALTTNTTGFTSFFMPVGTFDPLASVTVMNGGTVVAGGFMTTTGDQSYKQLALGAGNTTFSGANISVGGTISRSGGGLRNVVFNCPGTLSVAGPVTVINDFTSDAGGTFVFGGPMNLTGTLTVNDALTLSAPVVSIAAAGGINLSTVNGAGNALVLNSPAARTLNGDLTGLGGFLAAGAGPTILGANLASAGDIEFQAALLAAGLGQTRTITATGGAKVTFGGTVDGPASLAISGGTGMIAFGDRIGSGTALGGLAITSGGIVDIGSTVDGAMALSVATSGLTRIADTIGATNALDSITIAGDVAFTKGGVLRTTGAQDYGNATLEVDTAATSLGGGDIRFHGTVDGPFSLTSTTAGTTVLGGAVGAGSALQQITVANRVRMDGPSIATTGSQSYGDATLGGDVAIAAGAGDVTFNGLLDGAHNLVVATAGLTTFGGAVGSGSPLASLVVAGATAHNGGSVVTTGLQSYGSTTLGADTDLASQAGGSITLGPVAGGGRSLAVHSAGAKNFAGSVTGVSSLLADGGGATTLGGNIAATGGISLMDAVLLGAGGHSVASSGGAVNFGGTVDGPGGLTVGSATGSTFAGAVGAGTPLAALVVSGASAFGGGVVNATGNINLAGPSTFMGDTAVTSGGIVTFGGNASAGLFDLSVTGAQVRFAGGSTVTGRNLSFFGPMRGLGDLTFNAAGTLGLFGDLLADAGQLELGTPSLLVLGGSVDSLHGLVFRGDVRVQGARTVTVRNGTNAIFQGTVNGTTYEADTLWVNSSGLTAFEKDVGGSMRMARLETNRPGTIQVAPSANAIIVIYGELLPPPTPGVGGGVALAQSYSSMWEAAYRTLGDVRRIGWVDYRASGRMLLSADMDAGFSPGGFAATPAEYGE
jgi:filamentous hemagglutinin family protein